VAFTVLSNDSDLVEHGGSITRNIIISLSDVITQAGRVVVFNCKTTIAVD
jgi:hypothetical protein